MDEMNASNQSKDAAEEKSRLSRPDVFTRVAGSHLSRRDMVKASVAAGGLMWTAPMLLSGNRAEALETCCPAGSSNLTVIIQPNGEIGCGPTICLDGNPECDIDDIAPCIEEFVNVSTVSINLDVGIAQVAVNVMVIDLDGGASLAAIGAVANDAILHDECTRITGCPDLSLGVVLPFTLQVDGLIGVISGPVTVPLIGTVIGALQRVELELCIPGTASGLCG